MADTTERDGKNAAHAGDSQVPAPTQACLQPVEGFDIDGDELVESRISPKCEHPEPPQVATPIGLTAKELTDLMVEEGVMSGAPDSPVAAPAHKKTCKKCGYVSTNIEEFECPNCNGGAPEPSAEPPHSKWPSVRHADETWRKRTEILESRLALAGEIIESGNAVLKKCFVQFSSGKRSWCFKTANGVRMGMRETKAKLVRKFAELLAKWNEGART